VRIVLILGALAGAWIVYRRRRADERRVVVAWEDGSEISLDGTSPEGERLVGIAETALG
jgi:hypothetical protein